MKYKRKKTDKNQAEIVKELRKIHGLSVETDHDDIIVGHRGVNYWFEIKNPDEITKQGKTRRNKSGGTQERQEEKLKTWNGHYSIVWSLEQILVELNLRVVDEK